MVGGQAVEEGVEQGGAIYRVVCNWHRGAVDCVNRVFFLCGSMRAVVGLKDLQNESMRET